ncbi:MAG: hypothetical protein AAF244_01465 [Pseudomonadota bacterium]
MTNPFEQLQQAIKLGELELGEKGQQDLYLPPIPEGQLNLLRTVLWNADGLRFSGWHAEKYMKLEIDKDNVAGIQELKRRLLDSLDMTFQGFADAMTINADGLPVLLYERVEHIKGKAEFPEAGVQYTIEKLLHDTRHGDYIDCNITALFIPDRRIVPQEGSEAEYRGMTEKDLNAPKPAVDNELMIMAAGYPTGNDMPSSDYVGKKLHSVVFFGEGAPKFLEQLGLLDALMKNVQAATPRQITSQGVPFKLTM